MTCPLCSSADIEQVFSLDCGNPDNSTLYPTVRLGICARCGHAMNVLSKNELDGLATYYEREYAPANVSAVSIAGDRPGSADPKTVKRYAQLFDALAPHLGSESEILDVGCAMGGFLEFLRGKGFSRLSGVEMTEAYVAQAKKSGRFRIERGHAESLPFGDRTMDVIVLEQVAEHLSDPARAFREAKRVLKPGGIFFVGVPDASRYAEHRYFDFYWLLLREHIQHFDAGHLEMFGWKTGFEMTDCRQAAHAVMSQRMILPDVYAVFRSTDAAEKNTPVVPDGGSLKEKLSAYLRQENAAQALKKQTFAALAKSGKPVYAWGIGREFLYLFASAGLKDCRLAGLVDRNEMKQKTFSVGGLRISGEEVLRSAPPDAVLVVTAVAHSESVVRDARDAGFRGELIQFES